MEMNPIIQNNVTNWSEGCWSSVRAALWRDAAGGRGGDVLSYLKHSVSYLTQRKAQTHTHTQAHTGFHKRRTQEHWFICLFKADLYLLICALLCSGSALTLMETSLSRCQVAVGRSRNRPPWPHQSPASTDNAVMLLLLGLRAVPAAVFFFSRHIRHDSRTDIQLWPGRDPEESFVEVIKNPVLATPSSCSSSHYSSPCEAAGSLRLEVSLVHLANLQSTAVSIDIMIILW